MDKKLEELGMADEKVKRSAVVPGVGIGLAQTVVVHLDDPHRFKCVAQVSSYAGLVPKQMQSGMMDRNGHITRRGPSLLRGMLVEVAWMVYRHNCWAKAFVDRVSRGIKARRKIAIVALARKLLVRLWAMLRDNKPWRDPDSSLRKAPLAPGGMGLSKMSPIGQLSNRDDEQAKNPTSGKNIRESARRGRPRLTSCGSSTAQLWITAKQRMRRAAA